MPTGHLTNKSVESVKVAIEILKLSKYVGKILWCTFIQMLNEFKKKFKKLM